jgi:hypothetical protein
MIELYYWPTPGPRLYQGRTLFKPPGRYRRRQENPIRPDGDTGTARLSWRSRRRKISENPVNGSATFWMARCWPCWEIATTRGIVIGAGPAPLRTASGPCLARDLACGRS